MHFALPLMLCSPLLEEGGWRGGGSLFWVPLHTPRLPGQVPYCNGLLHPVSIEGPAGGDNLLYLILILHGRDSLLVQRKLLLRFAFF